MKEGQQYLVGSETGGRASRWQDNQHGTVRKEEPILAGSYGIWRLMRVGSRQQLAWNVPPSRMTVTSAFLQDN